MKFQTKQEFFWKGKFGDQYIKRNNAKSLLVAHKKFFKKILIKANRINSIIEFGPNIGINLMVLKKILKLKKITAVEINKKSCAKLKKINNVEVINESILNFISNKKYDLVLLRGLLIHINPKKLNQAYRVIYNSCKKDKYILFAEYYNPYPIKTEYRGYKHVLYKRDFAGEFIDSFKKIKLIDYGFVYHRDKFPQDDITWFLLQKK